MMTFEELHKFYAGKNVFITGHTGFKGSWLSAMLLRLGANVTGYALEPVRGELFNLIKLDEKINSIIGDIRDVEKLKKTLLESSCDIVFHLAAQPLVRYSYENPTYTYETNLMGTVNVLEAIRLSEKTKSFVNVTTDKVYQNSEQNIAFEENDILDGYDPYSNSKSCSELITACYKRSFFSDKRVAISTVRAGNVIGGGDFAKDRIIPDCAKSSMEKKDIIIRNPYSVRPFQHVVEPIFAYLSLGMKQYNDTTLAGCYNIAPNPEDCITTGEIATCFCKFWGNGQQWKHQGESSVHEASFLKLNSEKIKKSLQIQPKWNIEVAVEKTVEWYKDYHNNADVYDCMLKQIDEYLM